MSTFKILMVSRDIIFVLLLYILQSNNFIIAGMVPLSGTSWFPVFQSSIYSVIIYFNADSVQSEHTTVWKNAKYFWYFVQIQLGLQGQWLPTYERWTQGPQEQINKEQWLDFFLLRLHTVIKINELAN